MVEPATSATAAEPGTCASLLRRNEIYFPWQNSFRFYLSRAALSEQAHADQAAVTLGNANDEIGGLTISAAYSQVEVQALRDKCEELADDVRALSTLLHRIRTDLIAFGAIKGSA